MKISVFFLLKSESSLLGILLVLYASYIRLKSDFLLKVVQLAIISNAKVNTHICKLKYFLKRNIIHPVIVQNRIFMVEPAKRI